MPVLTLDYRHCDRKRPKFIRHVEIEAIAAPRRLRELDLAML